MKLIQLYEISMIQLYVISN